MKLILKIVKPKGDVQLLKIDMSYSNTYSWVQNG